MERLGMAFEELGHGFYPISTNGFNNSFFNKEKMLQSTLGLEKLKKNNIPIDIDLTYTVPNNFSQRFLPNSKAKCAIYNYETFNPNGNGWVENWKNYYHLADYYFPSSNFSAEIFIKNGVPAEKVFVIPHGVDIKIFNTNIPPTKLKTNKKFKFCSVVAPHYRKNIDTMLGAYCKAFTAKDDVCLVLKTKVYRHSDGLYDATKNPNGRKGFEIVIGDIFKELYNKYGSNMPEVELVDGHVDNIASIYNACDAHISTTGAEGFYMPGLEVQACGLINIAPRYSGHLDFMNGGNALLINTELREAKREEQYWTYNKGSKIGQPDVNHTAELMQRAVKEKDELLKKFKPEMEKMVKEYSWQNAAQKIVDVVNGKVEHYKPGTYNLLNQHKIK
jgi:glycosyltransferase involved in cell wall biosynthesis